MISYCFVYTALRSPRNNTVGLSVTVPVASVPQWGRCGISGARDQEDNDGFSLFSHFWVFSLGDDPTHIRGCHPLAFFFWKPLKVHPKVCLTNIGLSQSNQWFPRPPIISTTINVWLFFIFFFRQEDRVAGLRDFLKNHNAVNKFWSQRIQSKATSPQDCRG